MIKGKVIIEYLGNNKYNIFIDESKKYFSISGLNMIRKLDEWDITNMNKEKNIGFK